MARARALCELFFSPVHSGYHYPVIRAGARSGSKVLEAEALSVASQSVLFSPCLHSLCSQQLYLCLGGSNAETGGFLQARHTLRLSRKPVRYTDGSWSTTFTSASTGLTHLIQMVLGPDLLYTSSVHFTWQQTLNHINSPPFLPDSVDHFYSLGFGHHSVSILFSVGRGSI